MKLTTVVSIAEAESITAVGPDLIITSVCAADLMSDVLAFADPGCLLLTGLCNPQVVRTAEMADIAAVMFVHGKSPSQETAALAQSKSIPLLVTPYGMYEVCGRLYQAGLVGRPLGDG